MPIAAAGTVAITMLFVGLVTSPCPLVMWNLTPSAPRGLYWLSRNTALRRGDLVASQLPLQSAEFAARRGYLAIHVPVAKRVVGAEGDIVCGVGSTLTLNGTKLLDRQSQDQLGRPVPLWQGCVTVAPGQVFLAMPQVARSFDGRYFGPTPTALIEGRLRPLWTF